jgi:hypothetical protein
MGFGFFVYGFAATMEFEKVGSSSMLWLVMAYLFHHWRIMYFQYHLLLNCHQLNMLH